MCSISGRGRLRGPGRLHQECVGRLQWCGDRLSGLEQAEVLGVSFWLSHHLLFGQNLEYLGDGLSSRESVLVCVMGFQGTEIRLLHRHLIILRVS